MEQTFMKERPVAPLVLRMALPMVLSMLVNALYNIVDSYFVARISEDAMTALSLVFPIQNMVNAAAIGFGIGVNAVIAFFMGAGDERKADGAASQGFLLSILHGAVLTAVCIAVMPWFLRMFTDNESVIEFGMQYSVIVLSFGIIIHVGLYFEKLFQSVGRMNVSMISLLSGCITNILLDPVLIFGLDPFPEMGIRGAAVATDLGQLVTLVLYAVIYRLRPLNVRIRLAYMRPDRAMCGRLYAIGIPATLNMALPSLMISALNAILSLYGEAYVLVLGVYYKLQTFLYLTINGLVQGIRPLVGYNFGAREFERVRQIRNLSLTLALALMAAGTVLCLIIPGAMIGLFTDQPGTIVIGEKALRIICLGFVVSSFSVITSGVLEGLGMGNASLVISLCRYLVFILPAAFLLNRLIGADGVWHAFWVTEALTALVSVWIYRRCVLR